jgi:TonB family protein
MHTTVVNFMLESGISLAIFALVYLLFLRNETFFGLNRIYLLASVCFSLILPFIHFQINTEMPTVMLDEVTVTATGYQNLLQTVFIYSTNLTGAIEKTIQSIGLIRFIYILGTAVFLFLFLYRLLQIIVLIMNNESELNNGIRIVKIDRDTTPFSFFNFVFIDKNNANGSGMKEMLAHEMEHVRQRHSFDVLIFELLTIIQWFNPFIWLLKRSIRENHEFLADNGVLKPEVSSAAYRMLLINSAFIQQPVFANNFNYSLIKIRIKMMTKIKSSKTAALKLSMGVLVTAGLLVIFGFDNEKYQIQEKKSPDKQAKIIVNDQQKSTQTEERVFGDPLEQPTFQGGDLNKFKKWVQDNLKYPAKAKEKNISGKVYVQYVVSNTGDVVDVKVVRSVDPLLDEEAMRVVKSSPKWEPASSKGVKVKIQFTMPILFANDQQKPAQTNEKAPGKVDQMPVFPGGEKAFGEFIGKEVKYPEDAKKAGINGKVFIKFVVNKEGNVVNSTIARGVSPSLDNEALRVINKMPKWTPGKQGGKDVDVELTVPIAFVLN